MKFDITLKNEDGSIAFEGTANQKEASFLLNVGLNYLLMQGAYPMLTGKEEDVTVSEAPTTTQ